MNLLRARRRGLTLVELMIVTVIIGILATFAIPQWLAFRSRSMQAEVKLNFSAVHTSQLAYAAEHNTYTDNLVELGWKPEGRPRYIYGFVSDEAPSPSGINDTAELAAFDGSVDTSLMVSMDVPLTDTDLPAGSIAGANGFVFGAAGNIDDDPRLDLWQMTESKTPVLVQNDVGLQ